MFIKETKQLLSIIVLGSCMGSGLAQAQSALSISVDSSSVGPSGTANFTLSGGSGSYNVSVDQGSLSTSGSAGSFTAPALCTGGISNISVSDANDTSQTVNASVSFGGDNNLCSSSSSNSPLYISFNTWSVGPGGTTNFTLLGGSGSYNVSVDQGSLSTSGSAGSFTAPDLCTSGTSNISVSDANDTNQTINASVSFGGDNNLCSSNAPLSISLDTSSVGPGGTAHYSLSGGSGSYSVSVDQGSVSGGSSGDFTAPDVCSGSTANISASDGNQSVSASVIFGGDSVQCSSSTPLSISIGSPYLAPNGVTTYNLYGGSGSYNVYTDKGSISPSGASGSFSAPDQCDEGVANIVATDANDPSLSASTSVSFGSDSEQCSSSSSSSSSSSDGSSHVYVFITITINPLTGTPIILYLDNGKLTILPWPSTAIPFEVMEQIPTTPKP